jgi:hypothetical protein
MYDFTSRGNVIFYLVCGHCERGSEVSVSHRLAGGAGGPLRPRSGEHQYNSQNMLKITGLECFSSDLFILVRF